MTLRVVVEADGGSRGNPGPAGYGAVVFEDGTGAVLAERKEAIGVDTNNVAEYQGLIAGLTAAAELGAAEVRVRMDSKLVVEQMSGRWQVKHPSMRPLSARARELAAGFEKISFDWIPRVQNSHADRLANEAMDGASAPTAAGNNNSTWLPPDTTPTKFVLVRHGVTEYSVAKRFAGRSDLELTSDGLRQAEQAAGRVVALGPVDAVISSPLLRTRQTAAAIAERFSLDVAVDEGLAETDFGDWDGFTFGEVRQKWPDEMQRWMADPAVAPPNGESFEAVTGRVREARDRLVASHAGKTVVVVSHVSPIKILVQLALQAPPSALYRMFLSPASITGISYFADGPVSLTSFNDTAHLS